MNRIIKFRAWDKSEKRMWDWEELLGYYTNSEHSIEEIFKSKYCMQFTGLLDKNGKEIWEGDIVRLNDVDTGEHKITGQIVYTDYGAFAIQGDKYTHNFYHEIASEINHSNFEVIGNIYKEELK